MATLHSLLNPAETAEQENEDDSLVTVAMTTGSEND